MRIAIFSDIHGNSEALKAIIADIKKEKIEETICLGDCIGIGPKPKECLDLIMSNNISMVLGNHELYAIKGVEIDDAKDDEGVKHCNWVHQELTSNQIDFLHTCPMLIEKEFHGKKVLFEHFLIDYDSKDQYPFHEFAILSNGRLHNIVKNVDADYIFIGHEHVAFDLDDKLYDVGSSGCVTDNLTRYTIFNTDTFEIKTKIIEYDHDGFVKSMKEKDYPSRNSIAKRFFDIII